MLDPLKGQQLPAIGGFLPMMGAAGDAPFFGGGVGGGGGIARAFDISDGKVVNCALVFGRALVSCDDTSLGILGENQTLSGMIYAKVKHEGDGLELSVHHTESDTLPEDGLDASYRLLYKAISGSWVDFRYVPTLFGMN